MQLLEKSINEVGVIESISVTKEGTIISGHARKATFDKQGKKPKEVHLSDNEYPVIVRDDIEDNTELYYKAQILANTTSKQNIDLDTELIEEIAVEYDLDIEELGVEVVEDTETHLEAKEDDFDTTPPEVPITVLGDLYEIGEHRLLCGDSTDSDQVAKLMNGQKAELVFTDPPYGNGTSGKYGRGQLGVRTILNDNNFDCVNDFFNLRVCDAYVFFLQWRTFKEAIQTLENNDLQLKTIAVWDKKNAGLNGAGGMSEQWEAIIVAGNIKYSRFGGNVFNISREQKKRIDSPHPHQKPIELLNDLLEYFKDYNLLLDPFLGSGSTMVASHQLNRKCYGMELDPKYCDVIVKRMVKLDPTLVIKRNGEVTKEFNETK
jgi:DNA modification methylase